MTTQVARKSVELAPRRRGRPRRDQVDQLNRELLRHALDHFLEKGFEATTVHDIARSVGMSKQTVYARYADKLALFEAALRSATDDWLAPLQRLPELETEDLEQTLIQIARAIVTTLMGPEGLRLIRITNAEAYRTPEIGELTYQSGHRFLARYLADLFRRRMVFDAAPPPDVDDLATAFLNLMSGPARVSAWGLGGEGTNIDDFVGRRVRLFLHGVLAAEPPRAN